VRLPIHAGVFRFQPVKVVLLVCVLLSSHATFAAEQVYPVLDTGAQTYSNVTITSKSATHVFIKHSRGFGALKISELNDEALVKLGFKAGSVKPPEPSLSFKNSLSSMGDRANSLANLDLHPKITEVDGQICIEIHNQSFVLDGNLVKGILWCLLFGYILFCYCAMLICRKAGYKAGFSCWIPIFQFIPMLRAARMSGWLFLLWLLPVFNVVISLTWCVKICLARGKGFFSILCLLLPATSPLAFLYLALSSDGTEKAADSGKVHLSYQR